MAISERKAEHIRALKNEGHTIENIAFKFNIKKSSVRRYLRHTSQLHTPKILLFDLETSPMLVNVWGLYKQRIPPANVVKDWCIISWAGKWLMESKVHSDILTPAEAIQRDDKRILGSIWEMLDEADIIIAHNVNRFDKRKVNARLIINDFHRPSSYRTIDTLRETQKLFAFSSHSLDFLTKILGLTEKIKTEYGLWLSCMAGDPKALKKMLRYNKHDVFALEDLYMKIRSWIPSHPNLALYTDGKVQICVVCKSIEINKDGKYYTPAGRYQAYRCICGAMSRNRYSDLSKEERANLLVSVAQ